MGVQMSSVYDASKEVSKVITNSIVSNKSNCETISTQIQSIKFGNIAGDFNLDGVSFKASQTVDLQCLQSSSNNIDILNDIKKDIEKSIKNKLDGQTFGLQKTDTSDFSENIDDIVTNLNIDNIKNCITIAMNEQSIEVQDVGGNVNIKNVNMESVQNVVQSCIQSDDNVVTAVTKLDKKMKKTLESSITGVISSNSFIIIAIVVIVLILLFFYIKMKRSRKVSNNF